MIEFVVDFRFMLNGFRDTFSDCFTEFFSQPMQCDFCLSTTKE